MHSCDNFSYCLGNILSLIKSLLWLNTNAKLNCPLVKILSLYLCMWLWSWLHSCADTEYMCGWIWWLESLITVWVEHPCLFFWNSGCLFMASPFYYGLHDASCGSFLRGASHLGYFLGCQQCVRSLTYAWPPACGPHSGCMVHEFLWPLTEIRFQEMTSGQLQCRFFCNVPLWVFASYF